METIGTSWGEVGFELRNGGRIQVLRVSHRADAETLPFRRPKYYQQRGPEVLQGSQEKRGHYLA